MPVTVASWLVVPDVNRTAAVAAGIRALAGFECRGDANGRLVVVTESTAGAGLEPVDRALRAIAGVRDVALVAAFEDEDQGKGEA